MFLLSVGEGEQLVREELLEIKETVVVGSGPALGRRWTVKLVSSQQEFCTLQRW